MFFIFFAYTYFFVNVSSDYLYVFVYHHADTGPVRPLGMSPIHHRVEGLGGGDETLERHLERLAERIPGMRMSAITLDLQGYTVGVV